MIFTNLESLKNYLKQDAARVTLNPVRFINVDSMLLLFKYKLFYMIKIINLFNPNQYIF